MKETTRDEGGLRAALDTCKFVWLTGVVLWHAAGCGSAPACFGGDAASLGVAAYIPQLLGVVMLSGLMLASGVKDAIRTVSIRSALQPALVALAYHGAVAHPRARRRARRERRGAGGVGRHARAAPRWQRRRRPDEAERRRRREWTDPLARRRLARFLPPCNICPRPGIYWNSSDLTLGPSQVRRLQMRFS